MVRSQRGNWVHRAESAPLSILSAAVARNSEIYLSDFLVWDTNSTASRASLNPVNFAANVVDHFRGTCVNSSILALADGGESEESHGLVMMPDEFELRPALRFCGRLDGQDIGIVEDT